MTPQMLMELQQENSELKDVIVDQVKQIRQLARMCQQMQGQIQAAKLVQAAEKEADKQSTDSTGTQASEAWAVPASPPEA
jgi:hypothetical protein